MSNWLLEPDKVTLEEVKAEIAKHILETSPNTHAIPVSKAVSTIQVLSQKFAADDITEDEKRLLNDVFTLAFSQPD